MARVFNGSTQYLSRASGVVGVPCTLACWFTTATTNWKGLIDLSNSGDGFAGDILLGVSSAGASLGANRVAALINGSNGAAASAASATDGTWQHAAAVFSSDSSRAAFLNGANKGTSSASATPSGINQTLLGNNVFNEWHEGRIAEAAIWDVALTDEEVAALGKGVSPLMIRPASLVAYWPLYGNDSPEPDRWKHRNDVSLNNSPTKGDHPRIYMPWQQTMQVPPMLAALLAATPSVLFTHAAALQITPVLATAPVIALAATAALTAPGPLVATGAIAFMHAAALTAPVPLSATAPITVGVMANFGSGALESSTAWAFGASGTLTPSPRATTAQYRLAGVDVTTAVRKRAVTIRDLINDGVNTCDLAFDTVFPNLEPGPRLEVLMNDGLMRLFAGPLQTVDLSYEGGKPAQSVWPSKAIDDTARANAKRPFGTWTNISASTIAATIASTYAPTFTTAIAAGLPTVTITFDGSETFIAALVRLANMIGGYAKIEDNVIHLFLEDTTHAPDPVDVDHPPLNDPPIRRTSDSSQLRTRVYGKGYGEPIPADLNAAETIIPLSDGVQFNALGGQAIVGTTPDGAQSQIVAYTSAVLPGGGTVVGPGAAPGTAPVLALAAGSGVESGVHDWAYVFVTASGRTLPSPIATKNVGLVPAPSAAPSAAIATGGNLDAGTHRYYPVFRTAAGSTTAGPVSNAITASAGVSNPSSALGQFAGGTTRPGSALDVGAIYKYGYTYWDGGTRETALSPLMTHSLSPGLDAGAIEVASVPTPPAGFQVRFYRSEGGGATLKLLPSGQPHGQFSEIASGYYIDIKGDSELGATAPSTNQSNLGTGQITGIPVSSDALVTHVDLYREFNSAGAGTAKLAVSVTNGTTVATDIVANSGLGATVPGSNTAVANRVNVTFPAGPTGTTDIELFRTPLSSSQLKKFHAVGSNTGGTVTDSTADASLTTNAPTSDTSGLTQPSGQVNPAATTMPLASTTPARAGGGWLIVGDQYIRYTGIAGQSLTGIPATGPGAITAPIVYGQQAVPAPMLVGVSGLAIAVLNGSAVHVWVQRDDLAARAAEAARSGGDGIVEHLITDARRSEASLIQLCDADLARFGRPIVTVSYDIRDAKGRTKSGKQVTIDLPTVPPIAETLTIQEVTITEIDVAAHTPPRYSVVASSVRFSLEDTLRRLVAAP